jgi:hypothetical protein
MKEYCNVREQNYDLNLQVSGYLKGKIVNKTEIVKSSARYT